MADSRITSMVLPSGFYTGAGPEIFSIKLTGMEELKAKLRQLSDIGKLKATEQGLRAGANIIKDSIKAKAPKGKLGALKASIVVRKKTEKWDKYNVKFQIGPDRKIAFYAHMVEFGTSRHHIPEKPGKLLKFKRTSGGKYSPESISRGTYREAFTSGSRNISGGYVFLKGVDVSAKRHPFVRPGFDSSRVRAAEIIKGKMLKAIDKIAKKESTA
jgi:HK97 gp10 family phage protein